MRLADLAGKSRVVRIGGVRLFGRRWGGFDVIVRPPSVAAFDLFVTSFGPEIAALDKLSGVAASLGDHVIAPFIHSPRAVPVLCACLDAGTNTAAAVRELTRSWLCRVHVALAILDLCDVSRLAGSLIDQNTTGAVDRLGGVKALCIYGEKFGVSPETIARWPYELFFDIADALAEIHEERLASIGGGHGARVSVDLCSPDANLGRLGFGAPLGRRPFKIEA